jgi:RND family efflux transporter MFP subunit
VPSNQADLTAAEGIELTKARLDEARQKFEPYRNLDSGNETRQDLKEILDNAQSDYDAAVKRLEYESAVALAAARLVKAQEDLVKLQSGPDPDQVAAIEARIAAIQVAADQAIEAVEQARIGVIQAEARLQYAQETIGQAQAELETIDVQLKKLEISAPFSGIILFRSVEAGEVIQAGAPLMTLARLDELTITVYVPEDRYGQVKIGDAVQIEVDSFPGETFDGVVVYIADQAEFTPRNVQTAEGRRTTVFAIEIDVKNPLGKLKPGMPADVCFGCR